MPVPRVAVPAIDRRGGAQTSVAVPAPIANSNPPATAATTTTTVAASTQTPPITVSVSVQGPSTTNPRGNDAPSNNRIKELNSSFANANITSTSSLVVNGSSTLVVESQGKNDNVASMSDDVSQRADSNSEMGTKAPSLDGKSITSGTTFALDEKESLRPDDSASVKAAAEDDEAFSVKGSLLATSRMGSENARIHRLRIGDMPEKRIVQILPEAQDEDHAIPQSGTSHQQPPPEQPPALGATNAVNDTLNSHYGKNPDDKLLEAMKSPKDRLFLLVLEQDVINFVQSSK